MIVIISEATAVKIDLTLMNCLKWLDTDAKFAHSKAEIKRLRNEIIAVRQRFVDDSKEQKKNFEIKPEGSESAS